MAAPSALQTLLASGIRVASDTAEYNQIPEFSDAGYITDATSNPSLVFAAVSKPEYAHLVRQAVDYAVSLAVGRRSSSLKGEEVVEAAMDRLVALVSAEIAQRIPGRVSVSADPRIAYSTPALVNKARALVAHLGELGVPRQRVLLKIPATFEGIRAAQILEKECEERIRTNMTLVFGRVQAAACAQAGVAVISPFIGRVKDFYDAKSPPEKEMPLAEHPGIQLVRAIRASYTAHGHKTEILAAGFRAPEEVVELGVFGKEGGPDAVTIPPSLVAGLRDRQGGFRRPLASTSRQLEVETQYFGKDGDGDGAEAYARDIAAEEIAAVKVPEGLRKFSVDAKAMEDVLRGRIAAALKATEESKEGVSAML